MEASWRRKRLRNWRPVKRRLSRRDKRAVQLLESVAAERDVPVEMLLARSRCRAEVAAARQLAMYLMHVALGRRIGSVAKVFDRHWSTVVRACIAIEDMRDDAEFDLAVASLETVLADATDKRPTKRRERRHVDA